MKILDRYILRKFLGTFVFIMALLLGITIVIDLTEKIDNIIENNLGFGQMVTEYFIYFIPWITSMIGPFFVLVSVIFFTSQLAGRSEIIAILNSGTSFNRMLLPYFIGATLLALFFLAGNHYFVPISNKARYQFERTYINKNAGNIRFNFHRMVEPGVIVYFENYRQRDGSALKFSMDKFENGQLVYKLRSERIEWDSTHQRWRIFNYYTRHLRPDGDLLQSGPLLDTVFPFTPKDFLFSEGIKETLTTPELDAYINEITQAGQSNIAFFEIERYRRTSSSLSIYIMTLIGVSVASRKMRGGLGWHLVLGIGLSALYEIIMKFSTTFSTNSSLPPVLGVWFPNIVFIGIAIYLYRKAPK